MEKIDFLVAGHAKDESPVDLWSADSKEDPDALSGYERKLVAALFFEGDTTAGWTGWRRGVRRSGREWLLDVGRGRDGSGRWAAEQVAGEAAGERLAG